MNNIIKVATLTLGMSIFSLASETLVIVNGHNITTQVAPKDFLSFDKSMQQKVINRLIEKRIASDYALTQPISKSKEFGKILAHVLQMDAQDDSKKGSLADILNSKEIKGYTQEQLHSKKGLLAFDLIIDKKAEEIGKKLTEKDLKEYYEFNKYKYDTPAIKELLTIVAKDKKTIDIILDELSKAKSKLDTFMTLATKYSQAPSSEHNGYFGKIAVHDINKNLISIKNLKRGEYTKTPIKSEFGYELFFVLNDIPKFDSKFDLVKSDVEHELIQKKVKEWAMDTINKLKSKAKIEIKY